MIKLHKKPNIPIIKILFPFFELNFPKTETAIPAKTKDTPECGNNVNPKL